MKPITYRYVKADGSIAAKIGYPTLTRGLYVSPSSDNPGWVIAHVRSGGYLGYVFGSPEAALAVANDLDGVADWTAKVDELRADSGLYDRIAEVSVAGGGARLEGLAYEGFEAMDNGVPA